ncbi:hypothetical protein JR316_0002120 [Psilocybe cubensis]|uniref:Uncharacterized protein n=2 Tax=Psilocybe cubensis TaxID=181762 RepID=A0ACB8HBA5_PSICU|nr:hypothetical protein JR316_0002120 [Psilocybe cubensis]KAH9485213.1 hypothetical protein JR316_0002120 [Psilocybe cubensis]
MSDVLSNFGCLDELTQVIYQSIYKFVVLSTVTDDKWNIFIGLSGTQGRWWRGCWTEDDIHRIFGSKSSDKLLESFAEKLAEAFIEGEMCISDWSPDKGADIKFTLGPTSRKPMHVSLIEMSPEEAAAHATTIFIEIAVQAQSRKCRLYPSSSTEHTPQTFTPPTTVHNVSGGLSSTSKRKETSPEPRPRQESVERSPPKTSAIKVTKDTKLLKSHVKPPTRPQPGPSTQKPIARAQKGASLANPNKKARTYKPIEFESDDE